MGRKILQKKIVATIFFLLVGCSSHRLATKDYQPPVIDNPLTDLVDKCTVTEDDAKVVCEKKVFAETGKKVLDLAENYEILSNEFSAMKDFAGVEKLELQDKVSNLQNDLRWAENMRWVFGVVGVVLGGVGAGVLAWQLTK